MRIDQGPLNLAQAIRQTQQTEPAARQTNRGRAGSGDQVRISDMPARLSTDPARLVRLQAAVTSGTYNVSPDQIANSIITDALET